MQTYKVNNGKGRCFRQGGLEMIVNGEIWYFSFSIGRLATLLIGEKE